MSLKITRPIGQTLGLAVLWIALIAIAIEIPSRVAAIESRLPAQGFGSAHRQFEIQLDRLITRAEHESADCIVIGNSHILRGIDPQSIEAVYHAQTGGDLHCQNFGLRGTSMELNGKLASVLAREFQPNVIIVGFAFIDADPTLVGKGDRNILNSPWVKYQLGETFNIEGLIIDNLYSYRYYLGINSTYFSNVQLLDADGAEFDSNIQPNGFNPSSSLFDPLNVPPDRETEIRSAFSSIRIAAESILGLEAIFALEDQGLEVIMVEMPVSPYVIDLSPKIAERRAEFIRAIDAISGQQPIIFWQTQGLSELTAESWSDHNHLNQSGAETFSRWLGAQLSQAVLSDLMQIDGRLP
jgi:hypothetical protein